MENRRAVEKVAGRMTAVKAARFIVDFLADQGVRHVFEMAGGAIAHLLDALDGHGGIAAVSMRHEQAAAFAAEGYARVGGGLGVAMATSGPGALNLMTGIGSCYFDSIPCLFMTGQVNSYEYRASGATRQHGFQETDIISVAAPLVKYAALVANPGRIRYELQKAAWIARSGRPGPVLLDVPMDVQRAIVDPAALEPFIGSAEHAALVRELPDEPDDGAVDAAVRLLLGARRPLVLAGGGVRLAGAAEALAAWLAASGVPVVCSLMGLDAVPSAYARNYGLIGSYGHRYANMAVANCDALLVLGSRLDTRQTGTRPASFARGARIVRVDADRAELAARVPAELAIRADAGAFVRKLAASWPLPPGEAPSEWGEWAAWLDGLRRRYPTGAGGGTGGGAESGDASVAAGAAEGEAVRQPAKEAAARRPSGNPADVSVDEASGAAGAVAGTTSDRDAATVIRTSSVQPNGWLRRLGELSGDADIFCLDVGQHQMWASQSLPLRPGQRLLNAGGMGAMGFGMPAAIGAALETGGRRRVWLIAGDGGMQVNIQELQTVVMHGLPISVVVMNNRSLGMVRQFQHQYFAGKVPSTVRGYGCPDFVRIAEAYGMRAFRITDGSAQTFERMLALAAAEACWLVEVDVPMSADVHPKLGVGRPVEDMEPPLPREEMREATRYAPPWDDGRRPDALQ